VLDEDFNRIKIKIAFNPFAEDSSKRFAVQDASHLKDYWLFVAQGSSRASC
jgi:hypothetical protein